MSADDDPGVVRAEAAVAAKRRARDRQRRAAHALVPAFIGLCFGAVVGALLVVVLLVAFRG